MDKSKRPSTASSSGRHHLKKLSKIDLRDRCRFRTLESKILSLIANDLRQPTGQCTPSV